jgi:hypothetical protein
MKDKVAIDNRIFEHYKKKAKRLQPVTKQRASFFSLPLERGGKVGVIRPMVHPPLNPLPSREGRKRPNGGRWVI